jgi:hypothetical protein
MYEQGRNYWGGGGGGGVTPPTHVVTYSFVCQF